MKEILFVCTGNSCRSVMAEGLFRKFIEPRKEQYTASSAGTSAMDGYGSTAETIRVMRTEGIDVSRHRSRRLTPEMVQKAYRVYAMERAHKDWVLDLVPGAKDKVFLLTEASLKEQRGKITEVGIPDPIRMPDEFYRNVFSVIRECVQKIIEEL